MPKQHCTCGAKYRFDDSAVGRKARCKKCGRVFTITPDEADGTIPLAADEPFGVDLAAAVEQSQALKGEASYGVSPDPASPPTSLETAPSLTMPLGVEPTPSRGYSGSLLWTFLFPTSLHNLMTFCVMWGLLCVSALLLGGPGFMGMVGLLLLLGRFVIFGWYCAFRFETIAQAAAGEDDLPTLTFSEGWYDDIAAPLFKWFGSWAVVFIPAIVSLILIGMTTQLTPSDLVNQLVGGVGGILQGAGPELFIFVVLACLALLLWPMVVLCVGLGGFETLWRLDLIVVTIVRTLPVYLLTVAIVFGSTMLSGMIAASTGVSTITTVLVIGVSLYCELVSMRAIGLYYHHFKHRFAWDWG